MLHFTLDKPCYNGEQNNIILSLGCGFIQKQTYLTLWAKVGRDYSRLLK
jgi:hypothetical protein